MSPPKETPLKGCCDLMKFFSGVPCSLACVPFLALHTVLCADPSSWNVKLDHSSLAGRRDGLVMKNASCSPRRSQSPSQHPGNSGDQIASSGLREHQVCTWCTNTGKATTHTKVFFFIFNSKSSSIYISS